MPVFLDEALTRALYQRGQPGMHLAGETPVPVPPITYSRLFFQNSESLEQRFTNRASGVVNLGVATNSSVLVVGSAFGYLMEEILGLGVPDVYGIEPGSWFWDPANDAEWATGMKALTANDWIGSGTEQASLNALGVTGQAKFNFVVDEDAAPCHSDAELPAFIAGLEARLQGNVKGRIIHVVSTSLVTGVGGDSSQNWKTLADWEAVAPDHTWIDIRDVS